MINAIKSGRIKIDAKVILNPKSSSEDLRKRAGVKYSSSDDIFYFHMWKIY